MYYDFKYTWIYFLDWSKKFTFARKIKKISAIHGTYPKKDPYQYLYIFICIKREFCGDPSALKDNVRLLAPELLDEINQIVITSGHAVLKKKENEVLRGRCDSFVVKTNVHYPTDINILFDAHSARLLY